MKVYPGQNSDPPIEEDQDDHRDRGYNAQDQCSVLKDPESRAPVLNIVEFQHSLNKVNVDTASERADGDGFGEQVKSGENKEQ